MATTDRPLQGTDPAPMVLGARSDVLPDGTYGVSLWLAGDRAWTVTAEQAAAHAMLCLRRSVEAEHDAAALAALCAAGVPPLAAGSLVAFDLRGGRPAGDDTATAPLAFVPGCTATGRPFLVVRVDGEPVGQLTPVQVRSHAVGVLMAIIAVELDTVLYRVLVDKIGLSPAEAHTAVSTLAEHWPQP